MAKSSVLEMVTHGSVSAPFLRSLFSAAAVKIGHRVFQAHPEAVLDISGQQLEPGAEHLATASPQARVGQLRGRPLRLAGFRLRKCAVRRYK